MIHTKIAAQLYTVREFTQTPEGFRETIKKLKDIGYDAVQISAIGKMDVEYVQDVLKTYDMEVCATHTPPDRLLNDLDQVIKDHKLWGCENVGLGCMPGGAKSKEAITSFCGEYVNVAKRLEEAGLKFYYHNHAFEFEKHEGKNMFQFMDELTDKKNFKFLIDVFWLQMGGASPTEFIEKYKERIDLVHLKDLAIVGGKPMTAELGLGNMDLRSIIDKCKEIGVRWYAIEQDDCLGDPFESLEISLKYLHSMGIK